MLYAAKVDDKLMHTSRDTLGRINLRTVRGTARHGLRLLFDVANRPRLKGHALPLELKDYAPWGPLHPAKVNETR